MRGRLKDTSDVSKLILNREKRNYVSVEKLEGEVIRNNETYIVEDNTFLTNLTLSKTTLYPGKCTSGHKHDGLEEVYFFKKGTGIMQLDEKKFEVKEDSIVCIPGGAFHKVFNESISEDLIFVCVFQKYER